MKKLKRGTDKSYIGWGLLGSYGDDSEVMFVAPDKKTLKQIHEKYSAAVDRYDPKRSCRVRVVRAKP